MSRNARSGENGKFDKILPRLLAKAANMANLAKPANLAKFCTNVLTNANELARRALAKAANMANLAKPANLAKFCQMFSQMQISLLEGPW